MSIILSQALNLQLRSELSADCKVLSVDDNAIVMCALQTYLVPSRRTSSHEEVTEQYPGWWPPHQPEWTGGPRAAAEAGGHRWEIRVPDSSKISLHTHVLLRYALQYTVDASGYID